MKPETILEGSWLSCRAAVEEWGGQHEAALTASLHSLPAAGRVWVSTGARTLHQVQTSQIPVLGGLQDRLGRTLHRQREEGVGRIKGYNACESAL